MYDAIVIGVGGMGSATLYHLARSGAKALGLEQFGIPHAFGSSHGSTRIIRLAYSEGPEYVPLLRAAYRYWRELEVFSGRSILQVTGGLDVGPEGSWTIEGSRQSCVEHGLAFEELDGAEVNRRFPGYRLPDAMRAIHQPDGGYVRSEAAIEAYAAAARAEGAEIATDATVRGWERRGAGWRVHAAGERYDARKLVITAGPWVGELLPALQAVCRPERQVMLWTKPLRADAFQPERFPVFNMESPSGRYYGCAKASRPTSRRPTAPPGGWRRACSRTRRIPTSSWSSRPGRRLRRGRVLRARLQVLQRRREDPGRLLPRPPAAVGPRALPARARPVSIGGISPGGGRGSQRPGSVRPAVKGRCPPRRRAGAAQEVGERLVPHALEVGGLVREVLSNISKFMAET